MTSIIKPPNAIVNAAVRSIVRTIVDTISNATGATSATSDANKTNITLTKQRAVSTALGKNVIKDHTAIYNEIEKKIGATKKCTFGHTRGSKTGVKHEGSIDVPIREFELRGATINEDNTVTITGGDGLQGFCKVCSTRRRGARINAEKESKQGKTTEEIYQIYITKYGINTKKCSRCNKDKTLAEFNLSISMECGLHNTCKVCMYEYGSSVGDRWIIYMPDGNYKYDKKDKDQHDDHIFPLSLGGSNEQINHQLLSSTENLEKSNDIKHFVSIESINPEMLSSRYRASLSEATDINSLKIILSQYVYKDILERSKLSDSELLDVYKKYCEKYNLRRDAERAVKKFREYCKERKIQ
jgi:hypothetical protein